MTQETMVTYGWGWVSVAAKFVKVFIHNHKTYVKSSNHDHGVFINHTRKHVPLNDVFDTQFAVLTQASD